MTLKDGASHSQTTETFSASKIRAALYARVSTDAQQKEATIDSQLAALKKQIAAAGHVLVKEYIDDGYTGTKLDRPGLERLRQDVKTDLFDAIHFLATDRIARDVEHQMIIVGELLKHGKQIIINGKDYRRTAENKFTLVVLGAVDELERAKIIERMTRGKLHRLRTGQLLGHGVTPFGLEYVRKTSSAPGRLVIHKQEAQTVLWMFEAFANGTGLCVITRTLEERGVRTKMGKTSWDATHVKHMLQNPLRRDQALQHDHRAGSDLARRFNPQTRQLFRPRPLGMDRGQGARDRVSGAF